MITMDIFSPLHLWFLSFKKSGTFFLPSFLAPYSSTSYQKTCPPRFTFLKVVSEFVKWYKKLCWEAIPNIVNSIAPSISFLHVLNDICMEGEIVSIWVMVKEKCNFNWFKSRTVFIMCFIFFNATGYTRGRGIHDHFPVWISCRL